MSGLTRNSDFAKLFTAQVISLAGSGVTTVALALYVHRIAGPAAATVVLGQALMLRIVAFLVFSQPAGVLADRISRKPILIVSDLARAGLIALFPFITTVWQVYTAVFLVNLLTAFFTPAYEASLPEVVGEQDYVKALSYSRVAVDVEGIAGPALAGILVAIMGLRWVFWFDAITYLISAGLVLGVKLLPRTAPVDLKAAVPGRFWHELTYGTRVLLKNSSIRRALVLSLAEAMAGACAIVVTVAYVRDVLHGTDTQFSIVMACVGAGSAISAVVLSRLTNKGEQQSESSAGLHASRHRWAALRLLIGGVLMSLSVLPGVLNPPLMIFGLLWILNGAGQALVAIPSATLVAIHTSNDERGRAFAAHFAITHACWLIAYPLTGYLVLSRNSNALKTMRMAGSIARWPMIRLMGVLDPFRFVLISIAGWMNQQQQQAIEYLREENKVLREQLGGRRLRFTDEQRRRLAAKAKGLGRRALAAVATIVTPETLLAWHRKLIARKYDGSAGRGPGRPRMESEIESLVIQMATENREWGYTRIIGALSNLGHKLARGTVANILKRNGIEPAPERSRKTTWKEFLTRHWELIVAADFFTVEVWTAKGLQRFMVLFFIELSTRRVEIAGISASPNGLWMSQIARNLTDSVDGLLTGKRCLIHDRDPLFTDEFLRTLKDADVESVKLPPRSPNLNAHAERFVRSIKECCLDRLILFGESSLWTAVQNFVAHYHSERNHQGLDNRIIQPKPGHATNTGAVHRRERLGGTLNYYYRAAA